MRNVLSYLSTVLVLLAVGLTAYKVTAASGDTVCAAKTFGSSVPIEDTSLLVYAISLTAPNLSPATLTKVWCKKEYRKRDGSEIVAIVCRAMGATSASAPTPAEYTNARLAGGRLECGLSEPCVKMLGPVDLNTEAQINAWGAYLEASHAKPMADIWEWKVISETVDSVVLISSSIRPLVSRNDSAFEIADKAEDGPIPNPARYCRRVE